MQRITDPSAAAALPPVPPLLGTPGYFTEGSPGLILATRARGWWFNMVQEELISLLTAAGITPDTTGTNFTQVLAAIQGITGAGRLLTIQVFSSPGIVQYTPTPGMKKARVGVWGGGGGSQGSGSGSGVTGGAGGGFTSSLLILPGVQTITVGAGGIPAATGSGANGGNGGTSSFGMFCSATGGQGGQIGSSSAGGMGTGGNTFNMQGGGGDVGGSATAGGGGGAGAMGSGRTPAGFGNAIPGTQPGSGASGPGVGPGSIGAKGGDGMVVVEEFS